MVKDFALLSFVFLIAWRAGLTASEDRGRPTCDYCRMIITGKEYGGKIKTTKGNPLIFDATEMDFNQPGRLVNAKTAFYLQSNSMLSPMSINLSAYPSRAEAERMRENHPGEILNWTQVLDHVKQKWFREMLGGPRR